MKLLGIIENDLVNYKKISMVLEFPYCSLKCNKEAGKDICQNSALIENLIYDYKISSILETYLHDDLSKAIVCQGLEPLDSFDELLEFLKEFRNVSQDDFVIYTGYNEDEVQDKLEQLRTYQNIIVKFGRYRLNSEHKYDEILGVMLASENQYSRYIS